ncbi:LysM peptidoglycan-binding domain-containing protein [bacterium M00.F.Ca.ET.228.01.1.1]|uniref:peptidoglycan DD-metalloendopeptidase family protein n=1 Tax=Paraburkholderia phenoliruptrix TaxID=252970 RepID=UPI0010928578|nr:peptidoglycan DD-metalloendopeptidase family protein [Paraburkholderia phenoliruptrix]MBW9130636.1 peptidoglycan DD-metalloendopeptidase family protein [Paraburkholderia ginsengiterrae]TGP42821.1 LysM peptidoglycan-binding domain-containing protein [bacterium M00.F.Ca.ET.228.01.1.1]TGR99012.1 LysM peptidoglycan-binding domain-containing protein [bacterium M00.F.Ca.ET.191.01.1.1]TGU03326.1 LysM peptidoglycan-binding domain-containing protein [bacterium M00.F.Ca.ET.155.01.1.1]MBW9104050.1 pep
MSMLRAMQRTTLNVPLSVTQRSVCVLALSLLMTACASRLDQAPVVDRSGGNVLSTQAAQQPAVPLGPPPPGYYRVKPGDTLYRIALENGQNYRDISAWNNLTNPNQIEVDQLLRVVPPGANTAALTPGVATAPIGSNGAVQSAPLNGSAPATGAAAGVAAPPIYGSSTNSAALTPPSAAAGASDSNAGASGNTNFSWPVRGPLLGTFNDSTNKGVNIGGSAGEAVKASADGRVVYAGNGLRGYGNLIIIKHDATYLTAYAHNRALMVKEGDAVTKGQKIAEMGNSDSDRVMLHFEVRRQGKPVDPLKYLPPQ